MAARQRKYKNIKKKSRWALLSLLCGARRQAVRGRGYSGQRAGCSLWICIRGNCSDSIFCRSWPRALHPRDRIEPRACMSLFLQVLLSAVYPLAHDVSTPYWKNVWASRIQTFNEKSNTFLSPDGFTQSSDQDENRTYLQQIGQPPIIFGQKSWARLSFWNTRLTTSWERNGGRQESFQ